MNFIKNASKQQRDIVYQYLAHFAGKQKFLVIIIPVYWFDPKKLFKQIQIFLRICLFSNMVRKTNWMSISVLVSAIVTFMLKEKFSMNFTKNAFKTTGRHNLAICGSLSGEKQFY